MRRFTMIGALLLSCWLVALGQNINLSDSVLTGSPEYVNLVRLMQHVWSFGHEVPQEKVYLHLDNTGYFKGEKLWFKGYVIRTDTGKPTDMSSVLYVELVNPSGEVVQSRKVHIEEGEAVGDFTLDTLYVTGFYELRAYTKYMMNWGGTGIYSRVLPIFKQPKEVGDYSRMEIDKFSYRKRQPDYREVPMEILREDAGNKNQNQLTMKRLPHGEVHVNFYPEGGDLVEGLPSRVAFAVNDDEGRYFDVDAVILDEQKQLLGGAVTYKDGRGYFNITPDDEPKYLQLTTADGKKREFQLPEAMPQGLSLTLNTLGDSNVVASMTTTVAMHYRLLGYTLMHDGILIACDTLSCRPQMTLKFARESLPAGVNQLTVFDSDGRVMAERLFFICPKLDATNKVMVSTPDDHLVPCGKVKVDIQSAPNASLSFSAIDVATMTNGKEGNALTWMLLSSDVKGYIRNPEYYFESDDHEHRVAADLLMMVQGWRRYRWNLMAGKEEFARTYNIEDKLYINGTLLQRKKDIPVTDEPLRAYLIWVDRKAGHGEWVAGDCVTDSLGQFAFEMPDAWNEWNMQIVVKNAYNLGFGKPGKIGVSDHRQDYRVTLDRHFSPMARWLSPYETDTLAHLTPNLFTNVSDSLEFELENMLILKRENVLKEVKVKARRRIFDGARAAWESEEHGRHWANIYYDIDKEVDNIYDEGGTIPGLMEWLYVRNPLFEASGSDRFLPTEPNDNILKKKFRYNKGEWTRVSLEAFPGSVAPSNAFPLLDDWYSLTHFKTSYNSTDPADAHIYRDGLSYKGRPVMWILNNCYAGVTSTTNLTIHNIATFDNTLESFPVFLDEVKSIYITENESAPDRYVFCDDLKARSPVTVFVYTHHHVPWKKNGLRKTYFQAFDKPDTLEMDDYSKLPPMEDFRRTIFWAPDVKTDANGHATVEFWNNSSARRLYISAEGMTKDGVFLINE